MKGGGDICNRDTRPFGSFRLPTRTAGATSGGNRNCYCGCHFRQRNRRRNFWK